MGSTVLKMCSRYYEMKETSNLIGVEEWVRGALEVVTDELVKNEMGTKGERRGWEEG